MHDSTKTIKVKNRWVGKMIRFIIFILFSTLLSYAAYTLVIGQLNFIKKSSPSEGTVVSFSEEKTNKNGTRYSPIVEYFDKEGSIQTFKSSLASSKHSYRIGQKVNILVPNNGDIPQINSFTNLWFGSIIVSFFALLSLLILSLITYTTIKNGRIDKLLVKKGVIIQAKVLSVNESTYTNDTTLSWVIQSQWLNPQDNKVYTFESEEVMYNPKDFVGETIDVTILPQDPRMYKVDVSKLPTAAN